MAGGRLGSQVEPGQVANLLADRAARCAELVFYAHESPLSMRVIAAIPREVADLTVPSATPMALRHVVDRHVEAVAERHRLALPVGEAAQRGEDLAVLLAEDDPRLGGLRVRVGEHELAVPRALAQDRAAAVEHAGPDVGEGALGVVERVPAPEEAEEGVLYHVLGRLPFPEHDHREAEQAECVRLVQRRYLVRRVSGRFRRHRRVREWLHTPETPGPSPGCSVSRAS